jgi:hypothetical protein
MPLTDLSFRVTAKKDGPSAAGALSTPRVFYLNSSDLLPGGLIASRTNGNAIIKVKGVKKKVELYETPDEFMAMQALAQGATANQYFTKAYAALAPTSSATAADGTVPSKYYNEISTTQVVNTVRLPDPFTRRLVKINNLTGTAVNVYARGTTSPINGSTAAYSIGAYEEVTFVAPTASTAGTTAPWKTAIDSGT